VTEDRGLGISNVDPFATPGEERDPARRLRGRLVAGVTVWTAGTVAAPVGLTVSSVLVAPGEPPALLGLLAPESDLLEEVEHGRVCTVHVLSIRDRALADMLAGLRPAPGGPFRGLRLLDTPWGPALADFTTRAGCRVTAIRAAGRLRLVEAVIEDVLVDDLTDPLAYWRGRYHTVGSIRGR
jgi:flavin reductase (DIM6/NTAB) family NADH-FMN oxidoreductase RutF